MTLSITDEERWRLVDEYIASYTKISEIIQYDDLQEEFDKLIRDAKTQKEISEEYFLPIEEIIKVNFRRVFRERCGVLNKKLESWVFRWISLYDIKAELKNLCLECEKDMVYFDYFDQLNKLRRIEEKIHDNEIVEKQKLKFNVYILTGGFILGIIASIIGYFILKSMGWL